MQTVDVQRQIKLWLTKSAVAELFIFVHAYRTTLCRVWHEWLLKRRVEKSRVVVWRRGAALVRLPVTGRDGRPAVTEAWDIAAKVRHLVVPALSEGKQPYHTHTRTHTKKQIQSHHFTAATHWLKLLLKSFPSLRLKKALGAFETNMSALPFATNNLTRKSERNGEIRLNSKIWNLGDPRLDHTGTHSNHSFQTETLTPRYDGMSSLRFSVQVLDVSTCWASSCCLPSVLSDVSAPQRAAPSRCRPAHPEAEMTKLIKRTTVFRLLSAKSWQTKNISLIVWACGCLGVTACKKTWRCTYVRTVWLFLWLGLLLKHLECGQTSHVTGQSEIHTNTSAKIIHLTCLFWGLNSVTFPYKSLYLPPQYPVSFEGKKNLHGRLNKVRFFTLP